MNSVRIFAVCLAILFFADVVAADNPVHQKGTLTINTASQKKSYNLRMGARLFEISNCGDFQDGQEVEFTLKEGKIYIAHSGEKDYKCSILATIESSDPNAPPTAEVKYTVTYMKGTILGYSVRRDTRVSGGGGNPGGPVLPVGSSTRKAKVYELQGPDLIYQVDYCGAYQAGQFAPGQAVEFRVDRVGGRLYILHDGNKEYSCQLEGTRALEAQPGQTPAAAPAGAASTTARLSISSVPQGADIEIDGSFAGSTPSDLEVPEGEHSIVVNKTGYKAWERKVKVSARSNISLNAEMEKSANP